MNTLFTANDTNLLVKEEIEISETVIQEQRLEAELEKGTGDAKVTSGNGRTGGATQSFAQNDEAEVRKLTMSFQCPNCPKRFSNRKLAQYHLRKFHSGTQMRPQSCLICSRSFKYKSCLFVHMNNHHEKVCPICKAVVSGSEALKYHVESMHIGKVEYVCPICFKMSSDSARYGDHVSSHNGRRRYECEDCSKYYASPEGLEIQYKCTICSKAYRSQRNLRVHMNTHTGSRPYKCDQRPEMFLNRQSLQKHFKIYLSGSSQVKCSLCSKNFKNTRNLRYHINTHNGSRPYKCEQCPYSSISPSGLAQHRQAHLNDGNGLKCCICSKILSNLRNLRFHMNIHSNALPYHCDQCPKKYASTAALQTHRKSHKERNYKCSYCQKTYAKEYDLRKHINIHTGARPFQCDLCSKAFPNARYMARHRQSHSQGEKFEFKCDICSDIFASQRSLTMHSTRFHLNHRQSHLPGSSQLKCSVCSKVFKNSRYLHIHMNIHSGSRPYKCNQCSRSYTSPSGLAHHRQVHPTEGNRLKCSICSKTLSSSRNLRSHMKIHTGMPHMPHSSISPSGLAQHRQAHLNDGNGLKCCICSKILSNLRNLRSHMNIHSDVLPYHCDQCPKKYASTTALQKHRKSHKERNYKCSYCKKTYAEKYRLRNHINIHTGAQLFKCDQCPKVYRNAGSMAQHRQSHSNNKLEYKCDVCSDIFTNRRSLIMHSNRYHDASFKCHQCEKAYSNGDLLSRHYRDNPSHSELKCSICCKGFFFERGLNRHMKTHLETPLHKCYECSKEFYSSSGFFRHRRIHLKDGKSLHKCPVCHETFTVREHLVGHMDAHPGPRPFKCNQCPKDFASNHALNGHLRKHLEKPGERNSLQDEGTDGELYKVSEIQTALMNYKCKKCDKEFISERNLSFHSRQHEKELTPE